MWRKFKTWLEPEPAPEMEIPAQTVTIKDRTYQMRRMTEDDIDTALLIEQEIYHETPWDRLAFLSEVRKVGHSIYLVLLNDHQEMVGFIGCWFSRTEAHVTNIAIDPDWQHRGLGRFLMQIMIDKAKSLGVEKMTLEVRVDNQIAQDLYKQLGFLAGKVKRGYYVADHMDALDMWLPLD